MFSAHINGAQAVTVPFHHSAREAKLVNKLAPNIVLPSLEGNVGMEAQKTIDKMVKQVIPVPWKGINVIFVGHKHLKGKVGMVTHIHICETSPSRLHIKVAVDAFSLETCCKCIHIDYYGVQELQFVLLLFPPS